MKEKSKPQLSRKERERLRHRQEILDAAEKIFVRKGYHAATMEEIAQESEFAVGTLYTVFNGKNDIFNQLIKKAMNEFLSLFFDKVMKEESPDKALEMLVDIRLDLYTEHHSFFKVAFESIHEVRFDSNLPVPSTIVDHYNDYIENMSQKIRDGINSGIFIDEDPVFLVLTIDSIIHSFIMYWMWKKPDKSLMDYRQSTKKIVLKSISKKC